MWSHPLQTNAISMLGLLCSWILEMHYIFLSLVMSVFAKAEHVREVAAILKLLEFVAVPVIQGSILQKSASVKNFSDQLA
jgi:hypothetical protein